MAEEQATKPQTISEDMFRGQRMLAALVRQRDAALAAQANAEAEVEVLQKLNQQLADENAKLKAVAAPPTTEPVKQPESEVK